MITLDDVAEFLERRAYKQGFDDGGREERVKNTALRMAVVSLLSYRDTSGSLNFQLEKADDFLNTLRNALADDGD